ncbi:unnamed protein product [Microthlaspi erraticum]|uniref:Uncharacterized protein n=1 Tax=Microthlaspi erraticum TaxID=1685480 RepID=A0A6D2HFX1_9BRAS|nr:unnamed protein product [Microthlaspi erraticum]
MICRSAPGSLRVDGKTPLKVHCRQIEIHRNKSREKIITLDLLLRLRIRFLLQLAKRVEIMVTEFQTDRSRFAWSDICCTETPQICLLPPSRFLQ